MAAGQGRRTGSDVLSLFKHSWRAGGERTAARLLQHEFGFGVDQHGAVHVDVQLEAFSRSLDVVRLELGHHRSAGGEKVSETFPRIIAGSTQIARGGDSPNGVGVVGLGMLPYPASEA